MSTSPVTVTASTGKHHVEVERGAVHLPAGQAMTHADAIRLASRLEPHLAAGAAAAMDAIRHSRPLRGYTSLDCSTAAPMKEAKSGCGLKGRDFSSG